ncbi:MAG: MFS transporter, partial [Xanthobacteraceae bacterium]
MAVTPEASDPDSAVASRPSLAETLSVYLKRRVLIVMLLGFSSGLPLALSGSTLAIWMTEVGVNLKTIGLFALVGTPYTIKFLWAPLIDALNVPLLSRWLGRRRGWLLLSQFLLIAAIVFVGVSDPAVSPLIVALGVLLVATTSATQDIVVDAFRVESLDESEQAAGMAAYVAGYRIGTLASTAGALFLVSGFQTSGLDHHSAWRAGYFAMSSLVFVGVATTFAATEPQKSIGAEATLARENMLRRVYDAAVGAFTEFLSRDLAFVALAFVVLFKLTDALSGVMTA